MPGEFMDMKDAAQYLNCPVKRLRKALSSGRLTGAKVRGRWYFTKGWLDEFQALHHPRPSESELMAAAVTERYWTVGEAALYLGCCRCTIRKAARSGRVRARRLGRNWKFKKEWLDAWLVDSSAGS